MDYSDVHIERDGISLRGLRNFDLADILDCGQCFRWKQTGEDSYTGTVSDKTRTITQQGDTLYLHGADEAEFRNVWHSYFDFDRDYDDVKRVLSLDPAMREAIAFTPGMRVLRQLPWETLCSFIISANNNIVRIRGIIDRLCGLYGEPLDEGFAFPTPDRLASLEPDDLAPIRCGYRAPYLIDAARRTASCELDLSVPGTLPLPEARKLLRQVKGVGPKVAECVLLYGYARAECVPVDVWIKRALEALYPNGIPQEIAEVAGLGQQYLFHYMRNCPDALKPRDEQTMTQEEAIR